MDGSANRQPHEAASVISKDERSSKVSHGLLGGTLWEFSHVYHNGGQRVACVRACVRGCILYLRRMYCCIDARAQDATRLKISNSRIRIRILDTRLP